MKVRVLRRSDESILEGFDFYDSQEPGLGSRFVDSVMSDIRSLSITGGSHQIIVRDFHRKVCSKFPFSIYYRVGNGEVVVYGVYDNRSDPELISERLN